MNSYRLLTTIFFIVAAGWPGKGFAGILDLDLIESGLYRKEDTVKVQVSAVASVLLTSDFSRSSSTLVIDGRKVIEVGRVGGPGFARVTVSDEFEEAVLDIVIVPEGDRLRFIASRAKVTLRRTTTTVAQDERILAKLTGIKKKHIEDALALALPAWSQENAVSLGTTAVVCVITLAEPVAAKFCKDGVVSAAAGFGVKFLEKLIDKLQSDILTKPEADRLRFFLKLATAAPVISFRPADIAALHQLLGKLSSVIGEIEFSDDRVKVVVKSGVDLAHKYVLLYEIVKK